MPIRVTLEFLPTRRDIVLRGGATALLATFESNRVIWAATPNRPDVSSTAGKTMIRLYAAAVEAMQQPAINYPPQPQSWMFQAYIHAVPANPFDPANSGGLRNGTPALAERVNQIYGAPAAGTPQEAWKQAALQCWGSCTHTSPYFTTWHRWYLYYFERICRAMCKDQTFMLPYWNYASDKGASLQLPTAFTDPKTRLIFDDRGLGCANPQGNGPQNVAMNNGGYMPYSLVTYGPALDAMVIFPSDTAFVPLSDPGYAKLGFTGRLECVPHDMVHDSVGGWMGNVPSAAGDPLFYVHHCQIDRLYAIWEEKSGVSYNWGTDATQPDQNTWKTQPSSFVDENGTLVQVKLGDAVNTQTLQYGYDTLATPPPAQIASLRVAPLTAPANRVIRAAMRSNNFTVKSGGATLTLAPELTATPQAAGNNNPTTLVLEDIKLLRRPPAPLSVFINLPKGTAPELNGPYYVGTLNLFNFDLGTGEIMSHADQGMAMPAAAVRFNVTNALQRQRASGVWHGGPVTVTITTIGADTAGATITYVTIGSVSLVP